MKTRVALLAGSLLVALGACSDGSGAPLDPGAGESIEMSFSYHGPVSGAFRAEQSCQQGSWMSQTCAYGLRYQNPGTLEVRSVAKRPNSSVDWIDVNIPSHGAGSFAIDMSECPWWRYECPAISIVFELPPTHGASAKYSCQLDTGTIRLVAVTDTRASGEFSGAGSCERRNSTGEIVETLDGFQITGGRFEVKLVRGSRG
jgi:hypothetical protein